MSTGVLHDYIGSRMDMAATVLAAFGFNFGAGLLGQAVGSTLPSWLTFLGTVIAATALVVKAWIDRDAKRLRREMSEAEVDLAELRRQLRSMRAKTK